MRKLPIGPFRRMVPAIAISIVLMLTACSGARSGEDGYETAVSADTSGSGFIYLETAADDTPVIGDYPDLSLKTLSWQGTDYIRSSNVKAILFIGVDRSDSISEDYSDAVIDGSAGHCDSLTLAAWDSARGDVKFLSIPRDTYTRITFLREDGSVMGQGYDHITYAFANGDGRETSCKNTIDAVEYLLCGLPIDYYAAFSRSVINKLNDAVGGVTVTIPTEGMEAADPSFIYGSTVTLHGEQAERFVRYRDIDLDNTAIYRMEQHKEFIKGFYKAVRTKASRSSGVVAELYDLVENDMLTDMSKDYLLKAAMDSLGGDGISDDDFLTLPGTAVAPSDNPVSDVIYDEFYIDMDAAIPLIMELFFRERTG